MRIECRLLSGILLAMLSLTAAGCGNTSTSLPPTFPVTGTVKYKGGQPVVNGAILFVSVADSSFAVSGDVKEDGSYVLHTVKGNERASGAPEGEYRVTIQPPIPEDHRAVPAIALEKTYRVEAKENSLSFEVPLPAKK